jgi:hypothetical protein
MSQKSSVRIAIILIIGAVGICGPAAAFQVDTAITNDCHERIAAEAMLRISGKPGFPAPTSRESEALAEAIQSDAAKYGRDLLTLSMMLGVRYNDLHGLSAFNLGELRPVHNEPESQMEHCLRMKHHNLTEGRVGAIEEAKDFIRWMIERAAWYRDDPDPWSREDVEISLLYRGSSLVSLSRYYFNLGRALHTVQDSFTHTIRSPDGRRIREVFNWIEQLEGSLDTDRDGWGHKSILDDCTCVSPAYDEVQAQAIECSVDFLEAVMSAENAEQRSEQLEAFFEKWMSYESGCDVGEIYCETGCTHENNFCGSPLYMEVLSDQLVCLEPWGCMPGCSIYQHDENSKTGRSIGATWILLALVGLVFLRIRKRSAGLLCLLLLLAAPATARAEEPPCCPCAEPQPGWYTILRGGVSTAHPALFVEASGLYRGKRWGIELSVEWNPFFSLEKGLRFNPGALNIVTGPIMYVWHISDVLTMRFGVRVGMTVLLFDTPGYEIGNVGLFLGFRAVGFDIKINDNFFLVVDPIDVAVPIFKVEKFPFFYKQWRVGMGMAMRF